MNVETLKRLKEVIETLPEKEIYHSFYHIAGIQEKELPNSNVLAYFLDPNERHGLGTLWIDIIFEWLGNEKNLETPNIIDASRISVQREYLTKNRKYIDIVVSQGNDWAIVIENKIKADVYNDLNDYYKSVSAKWKIGLVTSLKEETIPKLNKGVRFENLTHQTLVNLLIKANPKHDIKDKEEEVRQSVFFKDYINYILQFDKEIAYHIKMKEQIKTYFDNKIAIDKAVKFKAEIEIVLWKEVTDLMSKNGFVPNGSAHFSPDKEFFKKHYPQITEKTLNQVRFYIGKKGLINHEYHTIFELYGSPVNKALGNKVSEALRPLWEDLRDQESCVMISDKSTTKHYHLGFYWGWFFDTIEKLTSDLEQIYFLTPKGKDKSFLEYALEFINEN